MFNNRMLYGIRPPFDNKIKKESEYQEYEFCKAKKCCSFKNKCCNISCIYTAKDFHRWLISNDFRLIKKENIKYGTRNY